MTTQHSEESEHPVSISPLIESFALETRRIYLFDTITQQLANHIIGTLQLLSHSDDPVYMYISSYGGDVLAGYSIIDQMNLCPFPVNTITIGSAISMGAIIAGHGMKGCRFGTKSSNFMLHPFMVGHNVDNVATHNNTAIFQNNDYKNKMKEFAKLTKMSYNKLDELIRDSHWMDVKQAIDFGLIDGIWTKEKEYKINQLAKDRIKKRNEHNEKTD